MKSRAVRPKRIWNPNGLLNEMNVWNANHNTKREIKRRRKTNKIKRKYQIKAPLIRDPITRLQWTNANSSLFYSSFFLLFVENHEISCQFLQLIHWTNEHVHMAIISSKISGRWEVEYFWSENATTFNGP